jgi:hypothetical protein
VAVSADGRTAVSGSDDRTVRVWDLHGGRCTAIYARESEDAHVAWAVTVGGWGVTTADDAHGLTLRALSSPTILASFPGSFNTVACSPDGRHVIAGDGRGVVYLLRLHTPSQ